LEKHILANAENNAQKPHTLQIVILKSLKMMVILEQKKKKKKKRSTTSQRLLHVEPTVLLSGRSLNGNFRAKEPSKLHAQMLYNVSLNKCVCSQFLHIVYTYGGSGLGVILP
jgi:hypothetical protein